MDIHKNARLTPHSRAELARRVLAQGQTPQVVARAFDVSIRTVHKWVDRFQTGGSGGLVDRSSRPHRLRSPTSAAILERIAALRRQRWMGKQIVRETGGAPGPISWVLKR